MKNIKGLVLAGVFGLLGSGFSFADTIAYSTVTANQTDVGGHGLSGFLFTVSTNIQLTQLGFTAISLGGGDAPHVTLWDATAGLGSLVSLYDTGNILSSVTNYGIGTTATPSYVSVGTPISLTAGNTYLVTAPAYWAATYSSSDVTVSSGVFSSTSFLKGGGWSGWDNSGYNFTTMSPQTGTYSAEANFQYVVAVPEPSTYALVGAGLAGLFLFRRKLKIEA